MKNPESFEKKFQRSAILLYTGKNLKVTIHKKSEIKRDAPHFNVNTPDGEAVFSLIGTLLEGNIKDSDKFSQWGLKNQTILTKIWDELQKSDSNPDLIAKYKVQLIPLVKEDNHETLSKITFLLETHITDINFWGAFWGTASLYPLIMGIMNVIAGPPQMSLFCIPYYTMFSLFLFPAEVWMVLIKPDSIDNKFPWLTFLFIFLFLIPTGKYLKWRYFFLGLLAIYLSFFLFLLMLEAFSNGRIPCGIK